MFFTEFPQLFDRLGEIALLDGGFFGGEKPWSVRLIVTESRCGMLLETWSEIHSARVVAAKRIPLAGFF